MQPAMVFPIADRRAPAALGKVELVSNTSASYEEASKL
jgi:hypothetical protein